MTNSFPRAPATGRLTATAVPAAKPPPPKPAGTRRARRSSTPGSGAFSPPGSPNMSWWCSRRAAAPAARPLPRYSGLSAKRSTAPKIPARQITADSPRKARARGAAQTALRAVSADFVRSGGSAAGGCAP